MLGICEKKNPTQTFIFEMYQIAKEIYIPFSLTYYHLSSLYMSLNICICHLCTNVSMFLSIQFSIFPLIYHAIYHWHIYACIFIMYLVILLKKESKSAMYQPLCQEEKCRHQNIQISDGGGLTLIIPEVHLLWNEDGSSTELAGTQLLLFTSSYLLHTCSASSLLSSEVNLSCSLMCLTSIFK